MDDGKRIYRSLQSLPPSEVHCSHLVAFSQNLLASFLFAFLFKAGRAFHRNTIYQQSRVLLRTTVSATEPLDSQELQRYKSTLSLRVIYSDEAVFKAPKTLACCVNGAIERSIAAYGAARRYYEWTDRRWREQSSAKWDYQCGG